MLHRNEALWLKLVNKQLPTTNQSALFQNSVFKFVYDIESGLKTHCIYLESKQADLQYGPEHYNQNYLRLELIVSLLEVYH